MEELRVDPADGRRYSRRSFIDEYGGTEQWDAAAASATEEEPRRRSGWDEERERPEGGANKRAKGGASGYQPQRDRGWRFAKFDRVRCNVGGEHGWVCGQVQAVNFVDQGCLLPYLVMLEAPLPKRMIAVPYDAPSHVRPEICFAPEESGGGECAEAIRRAQKPQSHEQEKRAGSLRFGEGARVACLTAGADGSAWPRSWRAGTVTRASSAAPCPYSVLLDASGPSEGSEQRLVLCHRDDHRKMMMCRLDLLALAVSLTSVVSPFQSACAGSTCSRRGTAQTRRCYSDSPSGAARRAAASPRESASTRRPSVSDGSPHLWLQVGPPRGPTARAAMRRRCERRCRRRKRRGLQGSCGMPPSSWGGGRATCAR